jgi:hypothetical protein
MRPHFHARGRKRPSEDLEAPDGLRRRVIANVRAEPAPISELSHRTRMNHPTLSGKWGLILLLAAGGTLAAIVLLVSDSPSDVRHRAIASALPGAHASLRRAGADTELALSGMPAPPIGEIYELWLLRDGQRPRALNDMFNVTSSGHAVLTLPGHLRGVREVMLTEEPIGGSPTPTGPVVLRLLNPAAQAG